MYTCPLCLNNVKELRISHAIPRARFAALTRNSSGQAYHLSPTELTEKLSQESGASRMLCDECEHLLNDRYENYTSKILFGRSSKRMEFKDGIRLSDVDLGKLNHYMLAVFWRSMISDNPFYRAVPRLSLIHI